MTYEMTKAMRKNNISESNGWIRFSDKQPEINSRFDVWSNCNGIILTGLVMSSCWMPRKGWTHYKLRDE